MAHEGVQQTGRPVTAAAVRLLRCVTLIVALLLPAIAFAQTAPLRIADNAALIRAIEAGEVAGAQVVLDPGPYGPLSFGPGQAPALIRSTHPDEPAQITGLAVQGFDGLILEDLALSYTFRPGDALNLRPFSFVRGTGLVLRNLEVTGDYARDTGTLSDGHASGTGLGIRLVDGVDIHGLRISRFHRALAVTESRNIAITGTEITRIRMDGMVFAQVENLRIEGNHIHSFARVLAADDHADMIQLWTTATTRPSRNITIRNNVLQSGTGAFTQSIFINNELVSRGDAGEEMYYRNILIEENVIINAQLHGITVGETIGLTIRRNTLAQNPMSAGGPPGDRVWHPAIRIAAGARDVVVVGNISGDDRGYVHNPGWSVRDNLLIQNQSPTGPNHYDSVFSGWSSGDPRQLDTYRYTRPMAGVGAARLGP